MARPKAGYIKKDGTAVVGTTTVCGMLAKPALVGWAGKLCTQSAWDAGKRGDPLPKWTDVLYGKRDAAADAGTLAHELFEAHLRGQPLPEIPDGAIGRAALQAYENAVHWQQSSSMTITPCEEPLVSEKYGYGGTPDGIISSGGWTELADWKTGGLYMEHLCQGAAYRQLLAECRGVVVRGLHLVRFPREHADFAHHYFGSDALDRGWEVFVRLLEIYPIVKELEARVK